MSASDLSLHQQGNESVTPEAREIGEFEGGMGSVVFPEVIARPPGGAADLFRNTPLGYAAEAPDARMENWASRLRPLSSEAENR